MPKYCIRYDETQRMADSLKSIGKALDSFESRLNSVSRRMDSRDSAMASLSAQVAACGRAIPALADKTILLGGALSFISNEYAMSDNKASRDITSKMPQE